MIINIKAAKLVHAKLFKIEFLTVKLPNPAIIEMDHKMLTVGAEGWI